MGSESLFTWELGPLVTGPAIQRAAKHDLFIKIARWGARECSETPKQRLQRLINETDNKELIEAFNQLEEEP